MGCFRYLKIIAIFNAMYANSLSIYIKALTSVKRGSTRYGLAPHKPVLLLTFLEMAQRGLLAGNRVTVSADLVGLFQENWRLLVTTLHQADFNQPFYYLQNDKVQGHGFWFLLPRKGMSIHGHIKSISTLISHLDHGYFDPNLYQLMCDPYTNHLLRTALLDRYFPERSQAYLVSKSLNQSYLKEIEDYILHDAADPTKTLVLREEEEVYVRQGYFKKYIPQIYKDTCCVSGMKLVSTHGYAMIDACHIVPFGVSQNDRITNGLALCPNAHRAFDRGLLSIGSDYTVLVSPYIHEAEDHPYSLGNLKGKKIILPEREDYLPSQSNLQWHRENVFKG